MNYRTMLFLLFFVSSQAYAQVSVVGELSQDRESDQGKTYEGVILVRNDSDEPQDAKLYQTDYLFHYSGTNNYGDPGSTPRSNASWVSVNPTFLTLPPRSSMNVTYVVSVPADTVAKLTGTYWSMIMVEGIRRGTAESTAPSDRKEMGISQTIRYGVQIATTIAGTGSHGIRFVGAELRKQEDGTPILQVDIENTGELLTRPEVSVELYDSAGTSRGKFIAPRYRIYPGTSVREIMTLTGTASGTYRAIVAVDTGSDDIYAAEYTLEL